MPGKSRDTHAALFDEQAEASVIASIIIEPTLLDEIDLDPEDFFVDDMKWLFQAELDIKHRDDHIDEVSVAREVVGKVESWVVSRIISELPTHLDCVYYANIIKELSRKRILVEMSDGLKSTIGILSSHEIADKVRATLDTIAFPSKSSRSVIFSNPRINTTEPPTYLITVASTNQRKAVDIKFTSPELDNATAFKRKIREKLQLNPVLPKTFDSLVHSLVRQAKMQFAPKDSSAEDDVCFWIKEWFKTAIEAEHPEDLMQGYLEREGAYWFHKTRVLKYLSDKAKIKLTPSSFWPIIDSRGGRRSKLFSIGGAKVRLWGLDKSFFTEEEEEPAEEEQLPLGKGKEIVEGGEIPLGEKEEENLDWLEE